MGCAPSAEVKQSYSGDSNEKQHIANEKPKYAQDTLQSNGKQTHEKKRRTLMGRTCHQTLDIRTKPSEPEVVPNVESGTLWVDSNFPFELAMGDVEGIEWKRPKVKQ